MSSKDKVKASASYFGISGAASTEYTSESGRAEGSVNAAATKTARTDTNCVGYGPTSAGSVEMFSKAFPASDKNWYIIGRGDLKDFVPIWEIVSKQFSDRAESMRLTYLKRSAHVINLQIGELNSASSLSTPAAALEDEFTGFVQA